jgi:hypothetical protein
MNSIDLDLLDSAIAEIEGTATALVNSAGEAMGPSRTPYRPTRDPNEALRLMDKYISRVVRTKDAWAAVDRGGRACVGPTLPIAVCLAIVGTR